MNPPFLKTSIPAAPSSPRESGEAAFTLVELLTATAVLVLLLALIFQIVNSILQSTNTQNQQMESTASARRLLDVMTADFQNAVIGDDASILVPDAAGTTNLIALVTTRRGPNDSTTAESGITNRFLAVSYTTNGNNQLFRSYGPVGFGETNLLNAALGDATFTPTNPLASGILALEAVALTDGGTNYAVIPTTAGYGSPGSSEANWITNNYNGNAVTNGFNALITMSPTFAVGLTNRTYALQIWVASLDQRNYSILTNTGNLPAALTAINGATDPSGWRDAIDGSGIPSTVKSGIRILTKTIQLQ
jgi:type II secretory pathway pseudopilin PulG